jgi:phage terminase small subunit
MANNLTPSPALPTAILPAEPDWPSIFADVLDIDVAHREWGIIVGEMAGAQTLALVNAHAAKRLVEFRVQYERAARLVAEQGTIIPARRTRTPRSNPHWAVMRQAAEAIRSLEAELGLAPVRRGKARTAPRILRVPRPCDAFLKPRTVE